MSELSIEKPDSKETPPLNSDLTPAEHLFFLGSSTEFMDETVNTDSLPEHLKDPIFLNFFLKPPGIRRIATEEQAEELNSRRSRGLTTLAPSYLPKNRLEEFFKLKHKISLPAYDPAARRTGTQWTAQMFDDQGKQFDLSGVEDFKPDNPYLAISIDRVHNQLDLTFNPTPVLTV